MKKNFSVAMFRSFWVLGLGSLAAAAEPGPLKWQFAPGKQYTYEYTEELAKKEGPGESLLDLTPETKTTKAAGLVTVTCENDMAKVRFSVTVPETPSPGKAAEPGAATLRTQTMEQSIFPDGAPVVAGGEPEYRDDLLLPLPRRPLFQREALKQEMVSVAPSSPLLRGAGDFTYVGDETVNGMRCVHFHVSCELRTEPKPGEEPKEITEIKAEINALFAVDAGYFISVDRIMHRHVSRSVKGLSGKEQGMSTLLRETSKTSLRLKM